MKMEALHKAKSMRALGIIFLVLGLWVSLATELEAQTTPPPVTPTTATIDVGLVTVPHGSTGAVKVSIQGAPSSLSDFQGKITYDSKVVNVREVAGLNGYTIAAFQIDNLDGEVRFIGFKTSGTLITEGDFLQFTVAAVGDTNSSTSLEMEFITLNDAAGVAIPHVIRPGKFTVGTQQEIAADFSWAPANPEVGQEVQFTDKTVAAGTTFSNWAWDFGDNSTSTEQNPKHKYAQKGTFTVSLTLEDDQGNKGSGQKQVAIRGQGEAITIPAHNFPNPAKDSTTFSYQLPQGTTQALLTVYDFTGPLVFSKSLAADSMKLEWDLKDQSGRDLPNGAYYYRIWASTKDGAVLSKVGKLVIIRS
jgi:hypothetical protein